ncbi:MAG: hypothetical protein JWR58_5999, partial [Pseudonocardia sp.]|nr:hypothetical protein [Pseudonocardia sp.]
IQLAGGVLSVVQDGDGTKMISTPAGLHVGITVR